MQDATIMDLTDNVVDMSINIRKHHKTKLPDAMIAATARTYDFALLTRNTADFKNIHGLKVIDPHKL